MAADKGAISQRLVVATPEASAAIAEERNDDVGDFSGKIWWECLRDGAHLSWKLFGLMR